MSKTSFVRAAVAGIITVLAACGGGSALAPPPAAPSIAAQPQPLSVSEGAVATFTVSAAGSAPFAYQWLRNGTAIAGATSSSYSTPRPALSDSGAMIRVVVTNAAGTVVSATATLTVVPRTLQTPQPGFANADNDARVIPAFDASATVDVSPASFR